MNTLCELDQYVLGSASDDFEAPHTIATDLSRDLGRVITEQEVMTSFVRLAQAGLVQAFRYDVEINRFVPVPAGAIALIAEPWFMAIASSRFPN